MKRWKQMIATVAAGVVFAVNVPWMVSAEEDSTYGDLTYAVLEDGTIEITDCNETATVVEIPAEIDGIAVTSIGSSAFWDCISLTDVIIPDGVASIGWCAFYKCTSLTGITIPESVTSIGDSAFYECTSLTGIAIPESVTSIGNSAFYGCTSLTNVIVPNHMEKIGGMAFDDTPWFEVQLETQLEESDCVVIGGVLYRYQYNDDFTNTDVVIPEGVERIPRYMFETSPITSVILPESLRVIEEYAFACNGLASAVVPEGVISIGRCAFAQTQLKEVTIPASVTEIGENAFSGCQQLEKITVDSENTAYSSIDGVLFDKEQHTLLNYPSSKTKTSYSIPNTVTTIASCAFDYDKNLEQINIPDSVTKIEELAFTDAASLIKVVIPDSVQELGGGLFGCSFEESNLIEVTFPNGIVEFPYADVSGHYAEAKGMVGMFSGCSALERIYLPSSLTCLSNLDFIGANQLSDIYYSGTETEWNSITFNNNDSFDNPLLSATIHFSDGTTSGLKTGDLDDDGKITMTDAYQALIASSKIALGEDDGLTEAQFAAADVDGNGKLTIMDAYWILMYSSYSYIGEEITWEELLG